MSALPPKADMCVALAYVCFGPIADIDTLFDHLVGARLHCRRHVEAERLGRLQIDVWCRNLAFAHTWTQCTTGITLAECWRCMAAAGAMRMADLD